MTPISGIEIRLSWETQLAASRHFFFSRSNRFIMVDFHDVEPEWSTFRSISSDHCQTSREASARHQMQSRGLRPARDLRPPNKKAKAKRWVILLGIFHIHFKEVCPGIRSFGNPIPLGYWLIRVQGTYRMDESLRGQNAFFPLALGSRHLLFMSSPYKYRAADSVELRVAPHFGEIWSHLCLCLATMDPKLSKAMWPSIKCLSRHPCVWLFWQSWRACQR